MTYLFANGGEFGWKVGFSDKQIFFEDLNVYFNPLCHPKVLKGMFPIFNVYL